MHRAISPRASSPAGGNTDSHLGVYAAIRSDTPVKRLVVLGWREDACFSELTAAPEVGSVKPRRLLSFNPMGQSKTRGGQAMSLRLRRGLMKAIV